MNLCGCQDWTALVKYPTATDHVATLIVSSLLPTLRLSCHRTSTILNAPQGQRFHFLGISRKHLKCHDQSTHQPRFVIHLHVQSSLCSPCLQPHCLSEIPGTRAHVVLIGSSEYSLAMLHNRRKLYIKAVSKPCSLVAIPRSRIRLKPCIILRLRRSQVGMDGTFKSVWHKR